MIITNYRKKKMYIKCDCDKIFTHPIIGNDLVKCFECGARAEIIRNNGVIILKQLKVKKGYEYRQYSQ